MSDAVLTEDYIDSYYIGQEADSPIFVEQFWETRWRANPEWDSRH